MRVDRKGSILATNGARRPLDRHMLQPALHLIEFIEPQGRLPLRASLQSRATPSSGGVPRNAPLRR